MSKRSYDHQGKTYDDSGGGREAKRYKDNDGDCLVPPLHSIFHGEIASVQKYGVFVKIPGCRKQGLVHKSQMSRARVEDPSEMVAIREKVYCKVISVDEETNKIALSMKLVNQNSGEDLDANHVQASMDEKKRSQGFRSERPKIELDAIYNTECARCGTHGHLSKDCYVEKGGKQYDLIPELDQYVPDQDNTETNKDKSKHKKVKKHKKEKKKKKKKKHKYSSSDDSDRD